MLSKLNLSCSTEYNEEHKSSMLKGMNISTKLLLRIMVTTLLVLITCSLTLLANLPIHEFILSSASRTCDGIPNTGMHAKVTLTCTYYNGPGIATPLMRLGYRVDGTNWVMSTNAPISVQSSGSGEMNYVFDLSANLNNQSVDVALFSIDTGTPRNIAIKIKTCPPCPRISNSKVPERVDTRRRRP